MKSCPQLSTPFTPIKRQIKKGRQSSDCLPFFIVCWLSSYKIDASLHELVECFASQQAIL